MVGGVKKVFRYLQSDIRLRKFWINQKYFDKYSFIHINKCGGTSVEAFLNIPKVHDTAEQRILEIGIQSWEKKFTFALVRNPYSKVLSHYRYRIKTNQTNIGIKSIELNDWIKQPYGLKNPIYYDTPLMFAPCLEWVSINDEIVVKKIVKLENIEKDWRLICDGLGLDFSPLSKSNRTVENSASDALAKYNAESLEIINNHFAKDFSAFGYTMRKTCDFF